MAYHQVHRVGKHRKILLFFYFSHTFLNHLKRRNKSMPNKVKDANGEEYFVMDIEYYGKKGDRIRYLLDNGQWVKAEEVEVID